ncbi:endoglucanase [Caulobacter sp.]|uniref:tetratricopeptide repeat protein n=1 Tax=Caulobacter sp. TaxID=78 RepID=UPI001B2223A6|nr:endoglucanase [Caulobacter sp.]MBO9543005.1 endoglucanase [Caulobacter sp.]
MTLRQLLRSSVAAAVIAGTLAPSGYAAPPPAAARGSLDVRVAQAADFSRVEFHWGGGAKMVSHREGQTLVMRFSRDANPDLSSLKIAPPRWVKASEARHVNGVLEIVLTLTDDADARLGNADGVDFVNIFARPGAPPASQTTAAPAAPIGRPNPMPASGVVKVEFEREDQQVTLSFNWAAPAGAAVFRRGEAVWIVFDTPARLDTSKLPSSSVGYSKFQVFKGPDYSALRIVTQAGKPYVAEGQGGLWKISLGPGSQESPDIIKVARDESVHPATLSASVSGVTKAVWVADPAVGDKMIVAPALAPSKGLPSRREYVEMALLQSVQGLAIEPYATDLLVQADGDLLRIGRPKGLILSPISANTPPEEAAAGAPQPMSMPALIDLDNWPKTGSGGFLTRYNALQGAIPAAPEGDGKDSDTGARMALARFLVGSQMSFEAIGVLNAAGRKHQTLLGDAEFRGLRGVAKVMAGRLTEADADFSSPVLSDDPSSALWRGYISTKQGQWADARSKFAGGGRALDLFPPVWRARFLHAQAQAALGVGDLIGAMQLVTKALAVPNVPVPDQLDIRLTQARIFEAKGEKVRARRMFEAIAKAPIDRLATPAILHATQLGYAKGQITAQKTAETLNQLRYRWRGDGVELEVIRALGKLYIDQGRYREALEVLRSAGRQLPDRPEAVALQNDLSNTFRQLFLQGLADGMQPVQAVGLFYDFQDLTPIGADGDQMVRNLVRRLVDVDLLDDAAKLLKYQVDNRLNGVPKAQVATDLAWIYLMNKKPEDALDTINATRTTILPPALNVERRLATARALMSLGRYDDALELIEKDNSRDGQEIRAEIAWKQHAWPLAGAMYERSLGDRFKTTGPLSPGDEARLLRTAVAYSLADDDKSLARLRQRWSGFIDTAGNPDGLRVALQGMSVESLSASDFSRVTADNEAFNGWIGRMKDRFRTGKPAGAR